MKFPALTLPGVGLGLGLGGFLDGIFLHQILGWHHLVCTTATCQPTSIAHLQLQNRQDGYFHLAVWVLTLAGTVLLFRAGRERAAPWTFRTLLAGMLLGWGAFNFVEGLINHQILGLHHVRPGHTHELLFDLLFLSSGLALAFIGGLLTRPDRG